MIIAIDWDGTIVEQDRPYDDLESPLVFVPLAKESLHSLKGAGHTLLLWSARASRSLLEDPNLDPLVRAGVKQVDREQWEKNLPVNRARYRQMLDFVERELPGIFDAIDDGVGGKPLVDLFIDDRAIRFSHSASQNGRGWQSIAFSFGKYMVK